MTQSMKGAGRGHTLLRTLDEAEEADDEYELTFSDPAEFAEAHRSFILFRSKSPTKDKESNIVEDPDEILAAPAINNRPSNGLVAPSGWDPLPSPPQAGMLTCFCILWQYSVAPPFYCIDLCSPPWQLIQLCIPNAKVNGCSNRVRIHNKGSGPVVKRSDQRFEEQTCAGCTESAVVADFSIYDGDQTAPWRPFHRPVHNPGGGQR